MTSKAHYHKLLQRQLKKVTEKKLSIEESMDELLKLVNESYESFDRDNHHLKIIIRESSSELLEANNQLKKAHHELADNYSKEVNLLRHLIDKSGEAVQVTSEEGVMLYINQTGAERLGQSVDELLGKYVGEVEKMFVDKKDWLDHVKDLKENGPMIIEGRHQRKDGTVFPIEANAFYSKQSDKGYVIAFIRDITERKRMMQAMEDQHQFIRQIIDTVPNLIFVKNQKGQFIMVNEAVAKLFGKSVSEIEFKDNSQIHPVKEENLIFDETEKEVVKTMQPVSLEEHFTLSTGEIKTYFTTKVPLERTDGTIDILGVSTDITEQKTIENKIKNSLSEKTTLLGEIHHRVKNNLTVIFGLLEMQIIQSSDEHVIEILRESQGRIRSMSMIHEMLYKTTNLESIDVTQYIHDLAVNIYKTYHRFENVQLKINAEDNVQLPLNKMIPCGLLVNEILTNSYKYAFEGKQDGVICISTQLKGNKMILKISDNGVGIDDNKLKSNSQSLGMKLIQSFNKQLKSEMNIENNNGLHYTFNIPIV